MFQNVPSVLYWNKVVLKNKLNQKEKEVESDRHNEIHVLSVVFSEVIMYSIVARF